MGGKPSKCERTIAGKRAAKEHSAHEGLIQEENIRTEPAALKQRQ